MSTQHIYKTLESVVSALNDVGARVNTLANDVTVLKASACVSAPITPLHAPVPMPAPVHVPVPASIDHSKQIASIEAKLVKLDAQESKKMFENVLMIKVEALVNKMLKDRVEHIKSEFKAANQIVKKNNDDEIDAIRLEFCGMSSTIDAMRKELDAYKTTYPTLPVCTDLIFSPPPLITPVDVEISANPDAKLPEIDDDSFHVDIINTKKKSSKKSSIRA
jgi:hypothetical protein